MQYTTLANLKTRLGITGTDHDTALTALIARATKAMDAYLGFNLGKDTYTDYISNNNTAKILFFPKKPITAISELVDLNDTDITSSIRRFSGNLVYMEVSVAGEVKATYDAGYEDISELPDVEEVCLSFCEEGWNISQSTETLEIKQKKVDDLSVTYFSKSETVAGSTYREKTKFETVLDQYAVLDVYSI